MRSGDGESVSVRESSYTREEFIRRMLTKREREHDRGEYCSLATNGTLHFTQDEIVRHFQDALLGWYRLNRRELPWRQTKSPYRKFLAEMMLQQTQVERVIPKYNAFIERFPTIRRLAAAPTAEVIRLWAGLGYNRRAVHLHRAAQAVVQEHGGKFPMCLQSLLRLPGIGPYTARALLSFLDNTQVAVVDTNVRRVLGRVLRGDLQKLLGVAGPTERQLQALADSLVPKRQSARWNQALMDLGSTVCTSRKPDCPRCPFSEWCQTRRTADFNDLPSLRPKSQGTFAGSRRYYRGRIVAALRDSMPGGTLNFAAIVSHVLCDDLAKPSAVWLWELAQDLERDGLVVIGGDRDKQSEATLTLPD